MNRRQNYHDKNVEEANDNDDNDYYDDDEDNGKVKFEKENSIRTYIVGVICLLLCLSYLYERDLRFQLIEDYNKNIDEASLQVYELQEKLLNSQKNNKNNGESSFQCPECPQCEEETESAVLDDRDNAQIGQEWNTRDQMLVEQIKKFAEFNLRREYGSPPYYVELDIAVNYNNAPEGKLLLEMAPINLMPYAVYYFMTQVTAGVWNSCSFFLNLGIVYLEDARGSASCRKEAFKAIGNGFQEFINFQEYSDQYPHEEYSIGLNGRPGGLGFYINLTNNTKSMRPKGELIPGAPPLKADPVIGKLIDGFDYLLTLRRLEFTNDEGETQRLFQDIGKFQDAVMIKNAQIVKYGKLN